MAQANPAENEWPLLKKLLFCFFFVFFILYIFLNPNNVIPYYDHIHRIYKHPYAQFIDWLAHDVFHLAGPGILFINNTTDTVFGCLNILFIACTAIVGSAIWVFGYRGSCNYNRLYALLNIVLRYFLAVLWISYGCIKLARVQFPVFTPDIFVQTYGNSSPHGLAWAFMSYSNGYNYFIGFIECATGLLLFFRRTSTLGNLLGLIILTNVLAFDFSFDVDVKIMATIFAAMSLFLMLKDARRLGSFFFSGHAVDSPDEKTQYFTNKTNGKGWLAAKCAFILFVLFCDLRTDLARTKQERFSALKTPLYGIYQVETFIRNKDTIQPLTTDRTRWNKLIISSPVSGAVMLMNDSLEYSMLKVDTAKKTLVLVDKNNSRQAYQLSYDQQKTGEFSLHGTYAKDSLEITLKKVDIHQFPLMRRGFRWIIDHHYYN